MKILKMLSEEVFLSNLDDIQTERIENMKLAFREQFQSVFNVRIKTKFSSAYS